MMQNWILPEHIEDILPPDACRIEKMRRDVLDLFSCHGYDLVMPPLIEHVESLRSGTGRDMDLRTFKLVDQMSGRLLGLRADITPQVARIDAQLLNRQGIARLCYAGSVLHTLPLGLTRTREPFQIGADIYGHSGIESDIEIQKLMLDALSSVGIERIHFDLGHVGVFRCIARVSGMNEALESELFQVLQAKDVPGIVELSSSLDEKVRKALCLLPELYGGMEVLEAAKKALSDFPGVSHVLSDLEAVAFELSDRVSDLSFDLAELRGYHYHSGMVFAVYAERCPNAIALGGRYDEVGRAFGRARPATGFSMDLREIVTLLPPAPEEAAIVAPFSKDPALLDAMERLRREGKRVVVDLPGQEGRAGGSRLEFQDGKWLVVETSFMD
ncbi:MAG TPA: ATP phosphoribosyltransferase regulatory subunit [Burkholderiales bacterium]|nr:ATP phosphoribosyltransferase regulatory subunit [Burkholderiales bacterium]